MRLQKEQRWVPAQPPPGGRPRSNRPEDLVRKNTFALDRDCEALSLRTMWADVWQTTGWIAYQPGSGRSARRSRNQTIATS